MDNSGTVGSISQARVSPWGLHHRINSIYSFTMYVQSQPIPSEESRAGASGVVVTVRYKTGEVLGISRFDQQKREYLSNRTRLDVSC